MSNLQDGLSAIFGMLAGESQRKRAMHMHFPNEDAPDGTMLPTDFHALEASSRDFIFTLTVVCDNPGIALKDVQGKMVTVSLERSDGKLRYFNGYVFQFQQQATDNSYITYQMVLKPWLAYLKLREDNYLFHGMNVLKQTEDIFADYDKVAQWEQRVQGAIPEVTDHTQWQESDYNYLHRRWEELGWHYGYEHRADGHTLVLANDSTQARPIDGAQPEAPWRSGADMRNEDGIHGWTPVRNLVSTKVSLSSFNFKDPRPTHVQASTVNEQGDVLPTEVYTYEGAYGYKTTSEGEQLALRRMQEIESSGKHIRAQSGNRFLQPGRWFTLTGMPAEQSNNSFFVTDLIHEIENNLFQSDSKPFKYSNTIVCTRKSVPWLPRRGYNSIERKIYAPQTAIVVGPKGSEIHTDNYGRVRVQFHWDRVGAYDEKSSAWIRVSSSWTGKGYGFVAIPRVGQEVVVQFLDGNPDRPLITGCVYNEHNMPPFGLPGGAHKTGLQTRSSPGAGGLCEMVIHDEAGKELINILSHKDMVRTVLNNDSTVVKGPQQTVSVTTGTQATTVHGAIQTTSETDAIQTTAHTACEINAQTQHIKLTAATDIELSVGASTLRMSANGVITLEGVHITVKGSGRVDINP